MTSLWRQSGIALVQVLVLTAVLSIVLLSMNFQARENLKLATAADQYVDARLTLQSAEATLLFQMLTTDWQGQSYIDSQGSSWNYHGKPFLFADTVVSLQDTSGLLNANFPDIQTLRRLLGNREQADQIYAALQDWQDADNRVRDKGAEQPNYPVGLLVRNSSIQFLEEWQMIAGVTPEIYQKLAPLMSFFTRGVNLNQQPDTLIKATLSDGQAKQLLSLRDSNQLTVTAFEKSIGRATDEFTRFGVGPVFRIRFTANNSNAKLSREITVRLAPLQLYPVEYLEVRHHPSAAEMSE